MATQQKQQQQQQQQPKPQFQGDQNLYLGLKLKGCEGHITVAWLGKSVDPDIVWKCAKKSFPTLFNTEKSRFEIMLFTYTHFGPNYDIPVYICIFNDTEKENILIDLWKKYNVEQEHTKGLQKPNWHVKSQALPKTADVGQSYEIDAIFIEEAGKNGKVIRWLQN